MINRHYIYDKNIIKSLDLYNKLDVKSEIKHYKLQSFSTFKALSLEDINNLRIMLYNSIKIDYNWLESILRFLEIRMYEIKKRLKLNYPNVNEMILFKDCIISFLLEVYYYYKDFRFLNSALKMIKIKFKFTSKQSLYNKKLTNFLIYNL